jgi:hypothetical protein
MTPRIWVPLVAAVVAVLAVPGAQATDGQPLILGQDNTASSPTRLIVGLNCLPFTPDTTCTTFSTSGIDVNGGAIRVESSPFSEAQIGGSGPGVLGWRAPGPGVEGWSDSGIGVFGHSGLGRGVVGEGGHVAGVWGTSDAEGVVGTYGPASPGSHCVSHQFPIACAGVLGAAPSDGDGVRGTSVQGIGVRGLASGSGGTGVLASSGSDGTALQVDGKAEFSRSGSLTIPAGSSSVTQTGIGLDSQSLVLATLQENQSGLWVQSAVPDENGGSFTVFLNHKTNVDTVVAWFVVN